MKNLYKQAVKFEPHKLYFVFIIEIKIQFDIYVGHALT